MYVGNLESGGSAYSLLNYFIQHSAGQEGSGGEQILRQGWAVASVLYINYSHRIIYNISTEREGQRVVNIYIALIW